MHVEYKVSLPDHDFVFAAGHKLVPSVIGDMIVKKKCFSGGAVTYSGATCGSKKWETSKFNCIPSFTGYEKNSKASGV